MEFSDRTKLAPVVQKMDNSIQRIKCTPTNTFYQLDCDLSRVFGPVLAALGGTAGPCKPRRCVITTIFDFFYY